MSNDGERSTPPAPPAETFRYPSDDAPEGVKTLERGVTECPCGGRVDRERVWTGYMVAREWPADDWPDHKTHVHEPQHYDRDRCQRCGFGVDY